MQERVLKPAGWYGVTCVGRLVKSFPLIVLVLIPGWITALTINRDADDTSQLFFYHIPDLTDDPLLIPVNLITTPLVNTQMDQTILVTALVCTFGVLVERRLGTMAAFGLFWGTTIAAALAAGFLLHGLYPLFPDVQVFEDAWTRVYNGGSAGGYGLMAGFAATTRWPWMWLGIFFAWEPVYWLLVSGSLYTYTPTFHIMAVISGYLAGRFYLQPRARRRAEARRERELRQGSGSSEQAAG